LQSLAGSGKAPRDAVTERAIAALRAKLDSPQAKARWSPARDLLLELLMLEKRLAEAWEIVRSHGCGEPQLMELAEASEDDHPDAVLSVYAQAVERLAASGGQGNYAQAAKLVARMKSIRQRLGANKDHAVFVVNLMNRHRAKRNLLKLLQAEGSP
jgi:hypothetical protein